LYGLTETEVVTNLDVPLPLGFTVAGELDGLWFSPDASRLFDTQYNETSAPGFRAQPTYMRPRVSVAWKYPRDETLYGFSTSATVAYGFYGTLGGGHIRSDGSTRDGPLASAWIESKFSDRST